MGRCGVVELLFTTSAIRKHNFRFLLEIFVTDDFQLRENSELYTSDRAE